MDALETFQFLDRTRDAGNHITDIELNYLVGITTARILYVDGGGDLPVIPIDFMAAQLQIAILESGVAQSMSKGECWLDVFLISPMVTYVDAFLILLINDVALSLGSTFLAPGALPEIFT